MADFATLVLGADARGLKEGATALDGIADKAEKTEARVTRATRDMGNSADLLAATVRAATAAETVARLTSADAAQRAADRVDAAAASRARAEQAAADSIARAARQEEAARAALTASYSQLRASLDPVYAASMQYERATETVNAAVKAGIVTQEQANRVLMQAEKAYLSVTPAAQKAERALRTVGTEMAQAGQKSGGMGFGIQNASYQIADFFVMVEGGISPMRALSTQLPQMLGSFGVWGAVIGGAVAAGSALIPMLFGAGAEAKKAGENLTLASDALAAFKDQATTALAPIAELRKTYGEWADEVRANALEMANQAISNAQFALSTGGMVAGLSAVMTAQRNSQDALARYMRVQAEFNAGLGASPELVMQNREALEVYNEAMEKAAGAMGTTTDQAFALNNAVEALAKAKGPAEMASAANALLAAFTAIPREVISANPALADAKASAEELAKNAAQAANMAEALARNANGIGPALTIAANGAYGLGTALQVAAGYASSLRSTIEGLSFTNIGLAAQNSALLAGNTAAAATAAGQYAEQQAKLAPLLGSQDAIVRKAAQADLGRYKTTLDTNIALAAQNTALVTAASATTKAAGGAKAVKEELTAAQTAAQSLAESMNGQVKSAVDATVDATLSGLKGGIKGLLQTWGDALKQMIGMAIKSKLTSYLFGWGSAVAGTTAAAATSAAGAGGGGAGGLLSGLLGSFGSAGAAGTGFLGGLGASFSGGLGGVFSVGANAAAAGGGMMATLGAAAAPVAALALVFAAFKTKTKELDAGLKVTVNGFDAAAQTFQTLEKTKFFGLSKKTTTKYAGVDDAANTAINAAIDQVQGGVMSAAAALGVAANAFNGFAFSFQVSTKGMSAEQASAAIQAQVLAMGDAFAGMVGGLTSFAKAGEGAATTLTRLVNAASAVNQMTDTLGLAFQSVGVAGAGLAADLVDRFGSLDAMAQASQSYYQAFYSAAERTATLTRQTTAALAALGLSLPATRDGFRALVEAQDLTTEAGRATFTALLSMSGAVAEILPDATAAAQAFSAALDANRQTIRAYIEDLTGTASELISPAIALASSTAAYNRALDATAAGESGAASQLTQAATAMLAATRDSATSALDVARAQALVLAQLDAVAGGGLVSTSGPVSVGSVAASAPAAAASTTTQVEARIDGLRAEIASLRELIAQIGAETITQTKRSAEVAQKWDRDGLPPERT